MNTITPIDLRNISLFAMVLASAALMPETAFAAAKTLSDSWKRARFHVRLMMTRPERPSSGSFWEIDMTKFEP